MTDRRRKLDILLLCLYGAVMLFLLFHREPGGGSLSWELVGARLNLEPFVTVRRYWYMLHSQRPYLIRLGVVNLVGNVAMFVPLGFLLPGVFPKLRSFWRLCLTAGLLICTVEIFQMLLLVGSCDVDDLILNLVGVSMGYGLYRLGNREKA